MPNMWLGCYASRLRGFVSQDRGRALCHGHFLASDEVAPALPWVALRRAGVVSVAVSPFGKASLCSLRSIGLGFRIRFLHGLLSAEDEEEPCLDSQQEQQVTAALNAGSSKAEKGERQVAAAALTQYMHVEKQIPLKDAQAICDNAPSAINSILRKAKAARQSSARGSEENAMTSAEQILHQEGVNEVELFFESVGCTLQDYSEFMPSISKGLVGEDGLIACAAVLEDFGIPRKNIWSLFKRETRIFGSNPSYLASCIRSLEECGVGKEDIPKLIQHCPALLGQNLDEVLGSLFQKMEEMGLEKNPFIGQLLKYNPQRLISTADEKLQKLISLFSTYSVPKPQLVKALKTCPRLLILVSDTNVEAVLQFLKEIDLNDTDISHLLRRYPQILTCSTENNLKPKVKFLEAMGVDRSRMSEIIRKSPGFFRNSIEQSLKPKMIYLKSAGFGLIELGKLITRRPTILGRSVSGSLTEKVDFFLGLGFMMGSPQLARALGYTFSLKVQSLEARAKQLEGHGFSKEDVFIMIKRNPSFLTLSNASFQAKLDYLLNSMQYTTKDLVTYPVFFNLNLEQRIKPRHRVLIWLKSQGLLKREPSLCYITSISDEKFQEKYVDCFPGTSAVYAADRSD